MQSPLQGKKIRFDTDLVLVRILDHLSLNGTDGERCTLMLECVKEYTNTQTTPLALRDMEDPYKSVVQLLQIYSNAMKDHQLSMDMITSTEQ